MMAASRVFNRRKRRKRLLIVAHAPSANTRRLREAAERGARHPDSEVGIKALRRTCSYHRDAHYCRRSSE
ncbi:hypothetical protein EKG36_19205 [Halomonas nitroreducens]|uniref:Uncharacterized protein n=1 Tax=Halomonas nitroreducens TaxID=447425 RepID=A0A3S0K0B0_9GAMM|nr:hypothetical protein EKG36_19205 [Halomonas nitroreducens]